MGMCEADIGDEEMEKLKLELRGGKLVVPRLSGPHGLLLLILYKVVLSLP